MRRVPALLWLVAAGAIVQLVSVTLNFYELRGEPQGAWYGVPHTSDLIVASAVVAIVAVGLTAAGRQPFRGRTIGLLAGAVGVLAAVQVVYRMAVPPYGCLQYGCGFAAKGDTEVLTGMWIALAGCAVVVVGALLYAFSRTARETPAAARIAGRQSGMTPWLGLAGLGSVAMFVFPFTVFTLYTVEGFFGSRVTQPWGGWLSLPHTSSLILAATAIVVGLVVAAARGRSPFSPRALGVTIGTLALLAAARILYRLLDHPFDTAGGSSETPVGDVTVELGGYLGLAGALLAAVAGFVHAAQQRAPAGERSVAGEATLGAR
ncbi:MAG: hypothetical protein H0U06_11385 [Solirubrobacterales bacterium]|nr:hypothetical protein [Solirubrobacterales bacterium]